MRPHRAVVLGVRALMSIAITPRREHRLDAHHSGRRGTHHQARPVTGEHDARVDSVRAESAAGVKERATRAIWTAFALSLLTRGERGTESV